MPTTRAYNARNLIKRIESFESGGESIPVLPLESHKENWKQNNPAGFTPIYLSESHKENWKC